MKKLKIYTLALLASVGLVSCTSFTDPLVGNAVTGGLLTVNTGLVSYVVGNGNDFPYNASFSVYQGAVTTTKVDVYVVFNDNTNGEQSNEVLLKSFAIPASPQHQDFPFEVTYDELIAGLTINGAPLPSSDSQLNIGDAWTLKYVSTTSEGNVVVNAGTTKISVSTRFAGTYVVLPQSLYWRIGVPTDVSAGWYGAPRVVESVNATTYRFLDYAGPFFAVTNTHYFTIDEDDVVNTPDLYDGAPQLLNGFPLINCVEDPGLMTNACNTPGLQNTVVRDDVDGKDIIYRTYGYNTTSGAVGPREIYEVMQKVVN